ncbi:MAG: hypothetical protein AB1523_08555 [Bacillota bacterium]
MFTVGVKFCGHCNPQVDTPGLLQKVQARLPQVRFTGWEEEPKDALLVLNGCPTGCATRPEFKGPVVVVAGNSVDCNYVSAGDLLTSIVAKLREIKNYGFA